MLLDTTRFTREFRISKSENKNDEPVVLADPNKAFTPQEVIQFYSNQYPQLTACTIDGPKTEGDKLIYEFKTTVGTKS
ncbi:PRTRC_C, PRTRC system protein C [uncultured Caudovirales phage]|uniref:PRTRC_C, PRTRC system protein C n=1 Tax=uncultured Caudovirales phage TaxID=2100421 RepID=A0A6J5KYU9_9CAUD|nr:PRTRC_C, PRTRC system protein C [uncultured Caudovirales phage]